MKNTLIQTERKSNVKTKNSRLGEAEAPMKIGDGGNERWDSGESSRIRARDPKKLMSDKVEVGGGLSQRTIASLLSLV